MMMQGLDVTVTKGKVYVCY